MSLLRVEHIKKKYGNHTAVQDVSFTVEEGCCYGLLGPNGAGKTTTMEIIEDILPATSGSIFYKGTVRGTTFRKEVGIQFQHTSLLNVIFWPMMFLSEVWFSLEGAPIWVQKMSLLFPLTHMLKAARKVMNDGAGLVEVQFECSLLLVSIFILLTLAAFLFSWTK